MKRAAPSKLADVVVGCALIAGMVTAWHARTAVAAEREQLAAIAPDALRTRLQDRLTGQRVDLAALTGKQGSGRRAAPAIVWLLDPQACPHCLDSAAEWSRLAVRAPHDMLLLVLDADTASLPPIARSLARTRIVRVPAARAEQQLGPLLPSTRLVLDSDGTVLLVDSRAGGSRCEWSFAGQVTALLNLDTAAVIRAP